MSRRHKRTEFSKKLNVVQIKGKSPESSDAGIKHSIHSRYNTRAKRAGRNRQPIDANTNNMDMRLCTDRLRRITVGGSSLENSLSSLPRIACIHAFFFMTAHSI